MDHSPNPPGGGAPPRAAIQGVAGAFSHAAAQQLLGPEVQIVPCETFQELFRTVAEGAADAGIVPVENSLAGAVTDNLDLLFRHDLHAVAETYVRVKLALVAPPGAEIRELGTAASHPVALRQCRRFFEGHPHIRPVAVYDTAGSIKDLMDGSAGYDAAIGSDLAARLYGAEVLLDEIEDDPRNFTRFFEVRPEPVSIPAVRPKASVAFVTQHRPGALHRVLGVLAERGADLTRLESRPIPGHPWEYRFYLDLRAERPEVIADCLEALQEATLELRVFGAYSDRSPER